MPISLPWLAASRCATLDNHLPPDRGTVDEQVLERRPDQVQTDRVIDGPRGVGQRTAE